MIRSNTNTKIYCFRKLRNVVKVHLICGLIYKSQNKNLRKTQNQTHKLWENNDFNVVQSKSKNCMLTNQMRLLLRVMFALFISPKTLRLSLSFLFLLCLGMSSAAIAQTFPLDQLPIFIPPTATNSNQFRLPASEDKSGGPRKVVEDPVTKAQQDSLRKVQEAESKANKELQDFRKRIYGFTIFNSKNVIFQENLRVPTPKNYILGPDDELIIEVYGYSAETYRRNITPDGYISIGKLVGNIPVAGLTIEEAKERIKNRLSAIYSSMGTNTFVSVSLGNIRSIRVTVLGEVVNPGTYSVSSLSTVMNALYQAGGPNETGSFRTIQVIRRNKVIGTLDIYEILTTGSRQNDIRLEDQDIIRIPVYQTRVEIQGRVKREGLYETLPDEKLDKVIFYAGGFAQDAYAARLKVFRSTDRERRILDVTKDKIPGFLLKDGDLIRVDTLLNRYENMVRLRGAVYRPGAYSLEDNASLLQLIKNADGLRDEAFTARINILRLNDDLTYSNISVNLADVINGKAQDVTLKREDEVIIKSKQELVQDYTVRILGAVNYDPKTETGFFAYRKGMTIEDLILLAGGLQESASPYRVEVARRKRDASSTERSSQIADLLQFTIDKNLKIDAGESKFLLEPFDEVYIRFAPNYESQQNVTVEGQVAFAGVYALKSRGDRLSDIISRTGGLNADAYLEGATLVRKVKLSTQEIEQRRKTVNEISDDTKDAVLKVEDVSDEKEEQIGINLEKALAKPGSDDDLILQEGDLVRVPKKLMTVRIGGEVLYPTSTRFESPRFLDYISAAGGYTGKSIRSRAYVIYANGSVERTRRFLVFNNYPKIKPGAEIIVPQKTKSDLTAMQVVQNVQGLLYGLTSITSLVVTFILLKK